MDREYDDPAREVQDDPRWVNDTIDEVLLGSGLSWWNFHEVPGQTRLHAR